MYAPGKNTGSILAVGTILLTHCTTALLDPLRAETYTAVQQQYLVCAKRFQGYFLGTATAAAALCVSTFFDELLP